MNRRSAVLAIFAFGVAPRLAKAQRRGKVYRVGWLSNGTSRNQNSASGFIEGLRVLGYLEDQNLFIEERFAAGDAARLQNQARELVSLDVSAIVALGTPGTLAAKRATSSIPIVMLSVADPVESGLVSSLGRPGGNITGVSAAFSDISPKYVELLREVVPRASRFGFLGNAQNPVNARIVYPEVQKAARNLGIGVEYFSATKPSEVSIALSAAIMQKIQGLIVSADTVIASQAVEIAQFATKTRLPVVYFNDDYVEAGGLMSYGANRRELGRHAAAYVGKILGGANPSELPVEQPRRFEMVVNLRTAEAIGLEIPQSLLLRADRVIE